MGIRGMEENLNNARIVTYGPVLLPITMTASSDDVPTPVTVQKIPRNFASPSNSQPTPAGCIGGEVGLENTHSRAWAD